MDQLKTNEFDDDIKSRLEPGVILSFQKERDDYLASIAISLKRIADAMELRNAMEQS